MNYLFFWRRVLYLLGVLLLLLFFEEKSYEYFAKVRGHTGVSAASKEDKTMPSQTPVRALQTGLQKLISPASTPDAGVDAARASREFGAALERAGIETQAGPSR